jgi:glycosyltransferase involved in cell wall biosynthesis
VEDFEPRSTAALPEWTRRGPIVLTVGQVKRRKGVHVALAAAAVVRQRHPTLQFAVVGPFTPDSSYVEGLRRQASDCGMRDHFHLIGEVAPDALVAWYQAADVFVLLPVQDGGAFEGLGLVYLEAGAAGVASIGTRDCGAAEAIVDGVTGLLVPQNDPVAAADAVCRMLEDRPLREKMAAAARARAHALSWTSLAAILADRYRELVSVRSERRW